MLHFGSDTNSRSVGIVFSTSPLRSIEDVAFIDCKRCDGVEPNAFEVCIQYSVT